MACGQSTRLEQVMEMVSLQVNVNYTAVEYGGVYSNEPVVGIITMVRVWHSLWNAASALRWVWSPFCDSTQSLHWHLSHMYHMTTSPITSIAMATTQHTQ